MPTGYYQETITRGRDQFRRWLDKREYVLPYTHDHAVTLIAWSHLFEQWLESLVPITYTTEKPGYPGVTLYHVGKENEAILIPEWYWGMTRQIMFLLMYHNIPLPCPSYIIHDMYLKAMDLEIMNRHNLYMALRIERFLQWGQDRVFSTDLSDVQVPGRTLVEKIFVTYLLDENLIQMIYHLHWKFSIESERNRIYLYRHDGDYATNAAFTNLLDIPYWVKRFQSLVEEEQRKKSNCIALNKVFDSLFPEWNS